MIFGRGPHQSRLPAPAFLGIHFRAMIQQRFDGLGVARASCGHQYRLAFRWNEFASAPAFNSASTIGALPLMQACESGRDAIAIGGVDVRSRRQQRFHGLLIVPIRGPQQRGGAIGLRRIDVARMLFDQRTNRIHVALHGDIGDGRLIGRAPSSDGEQKLLPVENACAC